MLQVEEDDIRLYPGAMAPISAKPSVLAEPPGAGAPVLLGADPPERGSGALHPDELVGGAHRLVHVGVSAEETPSVPMPTCDAEVERLAQPEHPVA